MITTFGIVGLVGWCLTALSAQKGYNAKSKSLLNIFISDRK